MTTIAEKIREARERKRMRQEDLAAAIQVGRTTVTNWEANRSNPSQRVMQTLAEVLGVSVDWLQDAERAETSPKQSSRHNDTGEAQPTSQVAIYRMDTGQEEGTVLMRMPEAGARMICVRLRDNSMLDSEGRGPPPGSLVQVNQAQTAVHGKWVAVRSDDAIRLGRLEIAPSGEVVHPLNTDYASIKVQDETKIIGVVTGYVVEHAAP